MRSTSAFTVRSVNLASASLLFLLTQPLKAGENYWYACHKIQQPDHIISVRFAKAPADAPCVVNYKSGDKDEQLWSANALGGYCEQKTAEFIEQQLRWGWQCERNTGKPPK